LHKKKYDILRICTTYYLKSDEKSSKAYENYKKTYIIYVQKEPLRVTTMDEVTKKWGVSLNSEEFISFLLFF